MTSKILIAVGGRFHSDQMLTSLLRHGHTVSLVTSYPETRFKKELSKNINSFILPEVFYRGLKSIRLERLGEQTKMKTFGKYVASQLGGADSLIIWSSFAKESFEVSRYRRKILVRDSTHILSQMDVLITENEKFGIRYLPDPLCVSRELEEYRLSDEIWVLSSFAKNTFVKHGISPSKIKVVPLGVNSQLFSPRSNLELKSPIQVVYFGALSFRKGIFYLLKAFQKIPSSLAQLTVIGPVEQKFAPVFETFKNVNYLGPLNHQALSKELREFDFCCLPSLEEGFPNTVVQAMASGLIPITCDNHGVSEYIRQITSDFFVKPGSSDSIISVIHALSQRKDLLDLKKKVLALASLLTWENYSFHIKDAFEERNPVPNSNLVNSVNELSTSLSF